MISLDTVLFGNSLYDYMVFSGAILLGLGLGKVVSWVLQNIVKRIAKRTKNQFDDVMVEVLAGPLVFAGFVVALAFARRLLTLSESGHAFYDGLVHVLFIVTICWFLIRFLDSLIEHYVTPWAARTKSQLDDVLLPILRTLVKVVIISMAGIMMLSHFGYNVTSLVAGLGIGGLAIAFAAKDILGNMFGGVSIIADKPFKIGDMVKYESRQGTVKQIGIRTTRLETLDGTQLIVPNAKFTEGIIENVTNRRQHRVSITLGLQYDTSTKKLKRAKEVLQQIIKKHKGTKDDAIVYFSSFGASSLDLSLTYFVSDLDSIPAVQDEVNMLIKEAFEKERIEFAYPTTTVYLKR